MPIATTSSADHAKRAPQTSTRAVRRAERPERVTRLRAIMAEAGWTLRTLSDALTMNGHGKTGNLYATLQRWCALEPRRGFVDVPPDWLFEAIKHLPRP